MLPWNYEFHWDIGHIIFFGAFYGVVAGVFLTLIIAVIKTLGDFKKARLEEIEWESEFHDLPSSRRRCRFEIAGVVARHECSNSFDCRTCEFYKELILKGKPAENVGDITQDVFGFSMPLDRLYHRGHAWARIEGDGVFSIGIDDFGKRLLGKADKIELPEKGSLLRVNGTAWRVKIGDSEIRILSPINGKVVSTGTPELDWLLKVKTDSIETDTRHLLSGPEVRPWIMKEIEHLQKLMSVEKMGLTLADGGQPVDDIRKSNPTANWDEIWADIFLEG